MDWTQLLRIVLVVLASIALVVIYIFLIVRLYRLLQVKGDRDHKIKLSNQGNATSIYQLSVESPEPQLSFKLSYKGMPLIEIPEMIYIEPEQEAFEDAGEVVEQVDVATKKTDKKQPAVDTAAAAKTSQKAAAKVGAFASLLGVLGNLIPGSLGTKLKTQGAAARGVQTDALKTMQAPMQAQRKVDALKREGGKFGGGTKIDQSEASHPRAGDDRQGSQVVQTPSRQPVSMLTGSYQPTGVYRAQTKEVDPGESLVLSLKVGSKTRRYPQGSYRYTLLSQQMSREGTDIGIPPLKTSGTVHYKPVPAWRYWLPILGTSIVVLLTLLFLLVYFTNINTDFLAFLS